MVKTKLAAALCAAALIAGMTLGGCGGTASDTAGATNATDAQSTVAEKTTPRTGIIGAMDEEVTTLKDALTDMQVETIAGMDFYTGKLDGKDVVVVQCNIGKVNAGICAQILIDRFGVDAIINTGVAGSLDARIDIGDIVVSTDAVQHDYDLTPAGAQPGEFMDFGIISLPASDAMRKRAVEAAAAAAPDVSVYEGRVCTGDQFIASDEKKDWIVSTFEGLCCEMEGGAIAQVCYLNDVPFVIIRAISDKADGSAQQTYSEFEEEAAKNCAAITEYMVSHYDEDEA